MRAQGACHYEKVIWKTWSKAELIVILSPFATHKASQSVYDGISVFIRDGAWPSPRARSLVISQAIWLGGPIIDHLLRVGWLFAIHRASMTLPPHTKSPGPLWPSSPCTEGGVF